MGPKQLTTPAEALRGRRNLGIGGSPDTADRAANQACVQCRRVKMRCRLVTGGDKCHRCTRRRTECVFGEPKKRGRKPRRNADDSRKKGSAQPVQAQQSLPSQPLDPSDSTSPQQLSIEGHGGSQASPTSPASRGPRELSPLHEQQEEGDDGSDFWAEAEGLQPASLLSKRATRGKFSLQNILSIHRDLQEAQAGLFTATEPPADDPVIKGVVPYHIATSLFEGFIKSLNPFVCLFDPGLHTFQYVRQRSPFLLSVILAVSAKAFNPSLHRVLYEYAERLYSDAFVQGAKSTEVIQAIMLSTYWKQPEDTRSWSMMGYAIRLCMELGWHKLTLSLEEDASSQIKTRTAIEVMERRNVERTWLVLFVYDRSMSMQTGKPWMIERSDFIESANEWYKRPQANSNDATLSALVTLRLASADIVEAFNPQRPAPSMPHPHRLDSLLKTLAPQIEAWKRHWLQVTSDREPCHSFIVAFFGTHLMLSLYSYPLQASISSPIGASLVDTEAFWITYTNALELLKLVSQPSLSALLSFAHDSVHAMTAYAAVFLIKLLLSVNSTLRREFEEAALQTIQLAARVFAQQSAPPTFACALQAKFLNNVVKDYGRACRKRFPQSAPPNCTTSGIPRQCNSETENLPGAQSLDRLRPVTEEFRDPAQDPGLVNSDLNPSASIVESGELSLGIDDGHVTDATPQEWAFLSEDWTALFTHSGFDVGDGNFVPL